MYTIEFVSDVDGKDFVIVNEFELVEKIMKIKNAFRKAGYQISGSFHKTARRFKGEFEFNSRNEFVKMAIV